MFLIMDRKVPLSDSLIAVYLYYNDNLTDNVISQIRHEILGIFNDFNFCGFDGECFTIREDKQTK